MATTSVAIVLDQLKKNKGDVIGSLKQIINAKDAKFSDIKLILESIRHEACLPKVLNNHKHLIKYVHTCNIIVGNNAHCEHMSLENWSCLVQFLLQAYNALRDENGGIESVKLTNEVFRCLGSLFGYFEIVSDVWFNDALSICSDFVVLHGGKETSCHPYIMKIIRCMTMLHFQDAENLGRAIIEQGKVRSQVLLDEISIFACMIPQTIDILLHNFSNLTIESHEVEFVASKEFELEFFRPSYEADLKKFISARALALSTLEYCPPNAKRRKIDGDNLHLLYESFKNTPEPDPTGLFEFLEHSVDSEDKYLFWGLTLLGKSLSVYDKTNQLRAWRVSNSYLQNPLCSSAACFCIARSIHFLIEPGSIDDEIIYSVKALLNLMMISSYPLLSSGSLYLYDELQNIGILDDGFQTMKSDSLSKWIQNRVKSSKPCLLPRLVTNDCPVTYLQADHAESLRTVVEYLNIEKLCHNIPKIRNELNITSKYLEVGTCIFNREPTSLVEYLWIITLMAANKYVPIPTLPEKFDIFVEGDLRAFLWFSTLAYRCNFGNVYCEAVLNLAQWDLPANENDEVLAALISLQNHNSIVGEALLNCRSITHSFITPEELRQLQNMLLSYRHQRSLNFLVNIIQLLNRTHPLESKETTQLWSFLMSIIEKQSRFSRLKMRSSTCKLLTASQFLDNIKSSDDWLKLSMIPHQLSNKPELFAANILSSFQSVRLRDVFGICLSQNLVISPCELVTHTSPSIVNRASQALSTNDLLSLITVPMFFYRRGEYENILLELGIQEDVLFRTKLFLDEFGLLKPDIDIKKAGGIIEWVMRQCSLLSSDEEKIVCIRKSYAFIQSIAGIPSKDILILFFDNVCSLISRGCDKKKFEKDLDDIFKSLLTEKWDSHTISCIASSLWSSGLKDTALFALSTARAGPMITALRTLPKLDITKIVKTIKLISESGVSRYEIWNMVLNYAANSVINTKSLEGAYNIMSELPINTLKKVIEWSNILKMSNNPIADNWISIIGRVSGFIQYQEEKYTDKTSEDFRSALMSLYETLPYRQKWSLNPYIQRDEKLCSKIIPVNVFPIEKWTLEATHRPPLQMSEHNSPSVINLGSRLLDCSLTILELPLMGQYVLHELPELIEKVLPQVVSLCYVSKIESGETIPECLVGLIHECASSKTPTVKNLFLNIVDLCFKKGCSAAFELEMVVSVCHSLNDEKFKYLGIMAIDLMWNKHPNSILTPEMYSSLRKFYSMLDDTEFLSRLPLNTHNLSSINTTDTDNSWNMLTFGLIQSEVLDDGFSTALKHSLQDAGLWKIANQTLKSASDVYDYEKTWWLQQWDTVSVQNSKQDYNNNTMTLFKNPSYGYLIGYFKKQLSTNETFASLAKICDYKACNNFFNIITPSYKNFNNPVVRFGREILFRQNNDHLKLAYELKDSCQFMRLDNNIQHSIEYALKLEKLAESVGDPDIKCLSLVESAETEWALGKYTMAINSLKQLEELKLTLDIMDSPESPDSDRFDTQEDSQYYTTITSIKKPPFHGIQMAEVYCKIGTWSREARNESDSTIMRSYFEKAVPLINSENASSVHHSYAAFCDLALHESNIEETLKNSERALKNTKQQIDYLSQLATGENARTVQNKYHQAKKLYSSQKQNLNELQEHKSQLIVRCVQNYLLSLFFGDKNDGDMARFIALWLGNCENEEINLQVAEILLDNRESLRGAGRNPEVELSKPVFKFLPWMNQLTSRIDVASTDFQLILQAIILKACVNHPYHSMWQLINIVKTSSGDSTNNQNRKTATRTLLKKAQKLCDIVDVTKLIMLGDRIVEVGSFKAPATGQKQIQFSAISNKYSTWWIDTLPRLHLPVPTATIPIQPDGDYRNVPTIAEVGNEIMIAGGISAPKIVKLIDTTGETHRMVLKAGTKDDLRQDAIMQQVFQLASTLLRTNKQTRNLQVRTYNVLPYGATSGAIQFVPHTRSLQEVLEPLHKKFGIDEYPLRKARQIIGQKRDQSVNQRVKVYEDVMKHTQPEMRHFWPMTFHDPQRWFQAQTNWSRSCAVMSLVGYIVGLGDRHCSNLLLDRNTGEVVHIDLGVAFDQGKLLVIPETVPFRLTRDMVDGMGFNGTHGVFTSAAENTLKVLRDQKQRILTILEVLKHDTLYTWRIPHVKLRNIQFDEPSSEILESPAIEGNQADQALDGVKTKLNSSLSCEAEVRDLVAQACDVTNLALIYHGWSAFY